jgi:hypothetical protein
MRARFYPRLVLCLSLTFCALIVGLTPVVSGVVAADTTTSTNTANGVAEGFALQVSPSPLTATLTPGQSTTLPLTIRNTASQSQNLKMGLEAFTIGATTGQVNLSNSPPTNIQPFVHFSSPTFSVEAGQIFTQNVTIDTPATAGFTYSFAITISPENPPKGANGKSAIAGSVAIFTLLSVNRPGAVSMLQLTKLSISKHVYQYLPATVTLTFKNTGNTLIQPTGTIFFQRHDSDTKPIAAITINPGDGYILPGTSRTLTTTWNDGFPHYVTASTTTKTGSMQLSWSGGNISKIRIGRYIAKVVAVYNNGQRDVPITGEVSFWVIPWLILLGILVIVLLILAGVGATFFKSFRAVTKRKKNKKDVPEKS